MMMWMMILSDGDGANETLIHDGGGGLRGRLHGENPLCLIRNLLLKLKS
jgi:hypothetical protein